MTKRRNIMIRLTPEHDAKMQALCTALDMSQSDVIRLALEMFYMRAIADGLVFPDNDSAYTAALKALKDQSTPAE